MSHYGHNPPYGNQPPPPQGYGYNQYPPPQGPPPPQGQYPPYQQQQQQHPPPPHQGGYYQQQQPPPPSPHQAGYHQQPPPPQYGAYGAPPPGQYPPPAASPGYQAPYGAAPSPNPGYGQPSPNQYGAPQGAPQGAPPPSPYGAAGLAPGYGAVPPTPTSPGYGPPQRINWDGTPDAQALRKAMKGFGTDEKTLIRVLSPKDPWQIEAIRDAYHNNIKRDLIKDIESETSRYFEKGLVQLCRGPLLADVYNLFEAMDGMGTKEDVLNDILLGRSNADINAIKQAFQRTCRRPLEDMIKGDLSMKTETHFLIVLGANRAEDTAPVIPQQVDEDVKTLYQATEARMGTDEIQVCSIMSLRNDNQLRAIAHTYQKTYHTKLDDVISKEFSGHMKDALLFQLRHAMDKYMHAADLLEEAMAGMGTKDHLLVTRVVRFHWDQGALANIKGAYRQKYGKSLADRIRGETSGDYEDLMVACVGEG